MSVGVVEPQVSGECAKNDCRRRATHWLELTACATGLPRAPANTITGLINIPLCRDHAREAAGAPDEWVSDLNWRMICDAFKARRMWPLDRSTVSLKPIRIEDVPPAERVGLRRQ